MQTKKGLSTAWHRPSTNAHKHSHEASQHQRSTVRQACHSPPAGCSSQFNRHFGLSYCCPTVQQPAVCMPLLQFQITHCYGAMPACPSQLLAVTFSVPETHSCWWGACSPFQGMYDTGSCYQKPHCLPTRKLPAAGHPPSPFNTLCFVAITHLPVYGSCTCQSSGRPRLPQSVPGSGCRCRTSLAHCRRC